MRFITTYYELGFCVHQLSIFKWSQLVINCCTREILLKGYWQFNVRIVSVELVYFHEHVRPSISVYF